MDDQPGHQGQVLVLEARQQRLASSGGGGPARGGLRGLTLDLALMKTWFSMSVLDLLCAVPAFLMASSLQGDAH